MNDVRTQKGLLMVKHIFSKLVLIAAVAGLMSCTKKQSDEILIGEFGSLTGTEATFGLSTNMGIRLAFDEINAAGGIKGKKIKLITLDDQGKAEEAAQAVTRLITQDKVVAILGEVASSRSLAAAPIAQQNKIPMITPSSTNPKVTEVGDYIFRVCFIDPFQGTVMAKFSFENLKLKKVAVLRDVKSDYSMGLADYYISTFKQLGGEIVTDVSYSGGDNNFKAQLTKIKATNPDGIFVPGYYTEVGLIAKQARELGLKIPLMGGDGWDSPELSKIGGSAIDGNFFSNHYTTESQEPHVVEFINKYKAKYNETPDGLAAAGYDAARVLAEAMTKANEITPSAIRDQLAKTTDFLGVTGKITIDASRNAVKSAVVVKVDGKNNRYVTTITP